jgi:hypothetical protein
MAERPNTKRPAESLSLKPNQKMLCHTMTNRLTVPVARDKALSAEVLVEILR